MKIITLIEDTKKNENLINEFGLSLLIETNDLKILLDTGSSGSFIQNSKTLGVDLQEIDIVVISHAHADHGGGLHDLLQMNMTSIVYMHKESASKYYGNIGSKLPLLMNCFVHPFVSRSMVFSKYIGLDQDLFSKYEERIKYISKTEEVNQNIVLISDIPKKYPLPEGNKFLLTHDNGKLKLDNFDHELVLAIKESDGIVLFSGCCHSGILNILEAAKEYFCNLPIKCIIGGFHLKLQPEKDYMSGTKSDIDFIADEIVKHKIEKIYTGHCTGSKAYNILREKLKDRIEPLYTGCTIQL